MVHKDLKIVLRVSRDLAHLYLSYFVEQFMNYKVESILQKPVRKYRLLQPDVVTYLSFLTTEEGEVNINSVGNATRRVETSFRCWGLGGGKGKSGDLWVCRTKT